MSLKVHIIITLLCVIGGVLSKTNGITISDFDDDIKGVTDDDFIHVHIVPHTHDDVGWLKTVDQYYYGANNSIQHAGVQYILDSVVKELQADPNRKFIYVEIAFFERWWNEQNQYTKQIVRNLVAERRLEFINGGWCMNDEAGVYYTDVIDQMTYGHQFLFNEFGIRPTVGWHIDPFGHTNAHSGLMAKFGFNGFFWARIDYEDHQLRNSTKNLEFIWRGVKSYGTSQDLYTGVFYEHYSSPDGFCFQCDHVEPIQDDITLEDVNVQERAQAFVQELQPRIAISRTNHIMVLFGDDFQYENANVMFKNMDKLMKYINDRSLQFKIKMFYSTPSLYLEAINPLGATYEVTTSDFMPYADQPYAYWTGYYVSRAGLKGYVRSRSALQHTADNLLVSSGVLGNSKFNGQLQLDRMDVMYRAMGVAQHHDAVAGTEKQHVADDYAKRLANGTMNVYEVLKETTSFIISNTTHLTNELSYCEYLNESICPSLTINNWNGGLSVPIILINSLAWKRNETIRLPISFTTVQVMDSNGVTVEISLVKNGDYNNLFDLIFEAEIPPLGITTYFITKTNKEQPLSVPQQTSSIENNYLKVNFDTNTNRMDSIVNKITGDLLNIEQNFYWYNASAGNNVNSSQASGAYIFRPNSTTPFLVNDKPTMECYIVENGVQECRQNYSSWLQQTIRLYNNREFIDVQTTISPMPIDDNLGKELITRFTTNLNTNKLWFTDSNGMEYQTRERNHRDTWNLNITDVVSGNYVPFNVGTFIKDTQKDLQLTVMTDRSEGCSSLKDGEIEIMMQRRLLYDDKRGVNEPLNETEIVRINHRIMLTKASVSSRYYRSAQQNITNPVQILFGKPTIAKDWISRFSLQMTPLQAELPPNIRLETLKKLPNGLYLLRLFNIYSVGEDSKYAVNTTVRLDRLFKNALITEMTEMTLSANQPISQLRRLDWKTNEKTKTIEDENISTFDEDLENLTAFEVALGPMEIKTFLLQFQYN